MAPERPTNRLKVVDIDGDGKLDVVTADRDGSITIHRGTGARSFVSPSVIPVLTQQSLEYIAAGHVDGDGHLDLVGAPSSGGGYVLRSLGPGTFQSPTSLPPNTVASSTRDIDIVDFDGDGFGDIMISDGGYRRLNLYWGNGTGSFSPAVLYPLPGFSNTVMFGDFNEDGLPDAVVCGSESASLLVPGTADRVHRRMAILTLYALAAAVGDLNRDGHLDVVFPELNLGNLAVRLGDGTGALMVPAGGTPPVVGRRPWSIAMGDFDRDGFQDVAVGNSETENGDQTVSFLRGDGTGHFGTQVKVDTSWTPIDLAAADIDRDGFTDLVVGEWSQGLTVFFGPCP